MRFILDTFKGITRALTVSSDGAETFADRDIMVSRVAIVILRPCQEIVSMIDVPSTQNDTETPNIATISYDGSQIAARKAVAELAVKVSPHRRSPKKGCSIAIILGANLKRRGQRSRNHRKVRDLWSLCTVDCRLLDVIETWNKCTKIL